MAVGETSFALEHRSPFLVEVFGFSDLLLCGWFDISFFVDGIELAAFDRVRENFMGALNAFEELIILGLSLCSFLVWMMAENFLAVGRLDLGVGCFVAVFREAENGVVVLPLR